MQGKRKYEQTPQGVTLINKGQGSQCWFIDRVIGGQRYTQSSKLHRREFRSEKEWYVANEDWYHNIIGAIKGTQEPGPTRRTFQEASERYIEDNAGELRDLDEFIRLLSVALQYFGSVHIHELSPHHSEYQRFIKEIRDRGVKNQTVNNYIIPVSSVINYCTEVRDDSGIPWLAFPVKFPKFDRSDSRPPKVITWSEQEQLLEALPEPYDHIFHFILLTGLRSGELTELMWSDVRTLGNRRVFVIERLKSHVKFPVVVPQKGWEILDYFKQNSSEFLESSVFTVGGMKVDSLNGHTWKKYVRGKVSKKIDSEWQWVDWDEGLGWDLHIHDLRHTLGHRLKEVGAPKEDRRTILGHLGNDMTDHYSQAAIETLQDWVELASEPRDDVMPILRMD